VIVVCTGLAAAATAVLACTAWWRLEVCLVLGVIAGASIPLKKDVPKNVLTVEGWTGATATLPFAGAPPMDSAYWAAVATVACIMAANTIVCDLPDVQADCKAGVRGLTPMLGVQAGAAAAVFFGSLGAEVAAWAGRWGLATTSLTLPPLAVLLARNPQQGKFRRLADWVVTAFPGPLALLFR